MSFFMSFMLISNKAALKSRLKQFCEFFSKKLVLSIRDNAWPGGMPAIVTG